MQSARSTHSLLAAVCSILFNLFSSYPAVEVEARCGKKKNINTSVPASLSRVCFERRNRTKIKIKFIERKKNKIVRQAGDAKYRLLFQVPSVVPIRKRVASFCRPPTAHFACFLGLRRFPNFVTINNETQKFRPAELSITEQFSRRWPHAIFRSTESFRARCHSRRPSVCAVKSARNAPILPPISRNGREAMFSLSSPRSARTMEEILYTANECDYYF